jgi:hypothetical protein
MSRGLLEKMRRARECAVQIDGRTFTLRRPTQAEALKLNDAIAAGDQLAYINACVVGWDLTEGDLIPGGAAGALAFDADDWREWIADRAEYWMPLQDAINAALQKEAERREAAAKNWSGGST